MQKLPSLCKHRASGRAVVRIDGKDHYVGKWGTEEAQRRYEALVSEWQAGILKNDDCFFVVELAAEYLEYAKTYYVKDGRTTSEYGNICVAVRKLDRLYGNEDVYGFKPKHLMALQEAWTADGLTRGTVNRYAKIIKRVFRWGVAHGHVPPEVLVGLQAVSALKAGRCKAPDTDPVGPVALDVVEHTMSQMCDVVCDMVRLQLFTGMRPGEVCKLTPGLVSLKSEPWEYNVLGHKMAHKNRQRIVYFGPKSQAILRPYLLRGDDQKCFEYSTHSYRRHIHRVCHRLGIELWSPNQLRHTKATDVRAKYGIDTARALLGHSAASTTETYAELDLEKAKKIAVQTG